MAHRPRPHLLAPRNWPTWTALGLLWLCAKLLSYRQALTVGRGIGRAAYRVAGRRRRITDVNLAICFPELSDSERAQRVREHFEATGISLLMMGFSWWGSDHKLRPLTHTEGFRHIEEALQRGKGILLVGMHFVDLDLIGRLLSQYYPFAVMYRQHENPVIEWAFSHNRERRFSQAIPRGDVRAVLRTLKANGIVWLAADQAMGGKYSALVPFFGEPAATSTIVSRLSGRCDASVMLGYGFRLPGDKGYLLKAEAPLTGFPGDTPEADTARINAAIEAAVRKAPEQYLWMHRRFKKREGLASPY